MRIEREVPLAGSFDFVVCGGGPSGIAAAVSASRLGLRTALIEKNHFFGGMGAGGYVVPLSGFFHQGVRVAGGIGWELVQRMVQDSAAQVELPKGHVSFHPEYLKLHSERLLREAGVTLFPGAVLSGCCCERGSITHVLFVQEDGEKAVGGMMFADATGSAVLCRLANAEMLPASEKYQPMTLCFLLEGADATTQLLSGCIHHDGKTGRSVNAELHDWLAEQPDAPQFGGPWFNALIRGNLLAVNMTRAAGDASDPKVYAATYAELRENAYRLVELLRKGFPEFRSAQIAAIAPDLGIRETRRMRGRYVLTGKELLDGVQFDDTIAFCAHPIDIHQADGNGQRLAELPAPGPIPLRCLQSVNIGNLLATGRAISCDGEAFASLRVMATAFALGEAAGVSAWANGDARNTRVQLQKQGAIV